MSKNLTLPKELERRFLRAELRADNTDGQKKVRGYAAVFNSLSEDLGGFKERLSPACFAQSLRDRPDVFLLNSHDTAAVLARTSNNTLTVREDGRGLRFAALLPDTTLGNDTFENIRSQLLSAMSFGMVVVDDEWSEESEDGARISIRTVKSAKLFEISCVAFPAYAASSVAARAAALFPAGIPQEIRSRLALRDSERDDDLDDCECDCPECAAGDCAECSNSSCDDERCERDGCPNALRSDHRLREIRSVDEATAKELRNHGRAIAKIIDALPADDQVKVWRAVLFQTFEKYGTAIGYFEDSGDDEDDENLRRSARLVAHRMLL